MNPRVDTVTQFRRDLVLSVAEFANRNQGGAWSLVNVCEGPDVTEMEFASPWMLRNVPDGPDGPETGSYRFRVTVAPIVDHTADMSGTEAVNAAHAALGRVPALEVVKWCADRGVTVSTSLVYKVRRGEAGQ